MAVRWGARASVKPPPSGHFGLSFASGAAARAGSGWRWRNIGKKVGQQRDRRRRAAATTTTTGGSRQGKPPSAPGCREILTPQAARCSAAPPRLAAAAAAPSCSFPASPPPPQGPRTTMTSRRCMARRHLALAWPLARAAHPLRLRQTLVLQLARLAARRQRKKDGAVTVLLMRPLQSPPRLTSTLRRGSAS